MMNKILIVLAFFILQTVSAQTNEVFNYKEYRWTIVIPKGFTPVDPAEWEKMRGRGVDKVEEVYDTDLEYLIQPIETILVVKKGEQNYLEVVRQDFDPLTDGSFEESVNGVVEILIETFETSMPDAEIEHNTGKEAIGGKTFIMHNIVLTFPNQVKLVAYMYSCLIDKKEFTVNLIYTDGITGAALIEAFKNSIFKE